MSATRRLCSSLLLVSVAIFLLAGCTRHDNVTAAAGPEPVVPSPTEPATTMPTEPATSTPAEPATMTPTEPTPTTPSEPVVTASAEPVPSTPTEPKAKDTFTLKPGQTASVAASTKLHYVRMVNDSRCPAGVQCIWAGEVSIELMLESGKEKQTFTMKDDEKAASVLGYSIELISIDGNHQINVWVKKI